MSETKCEHRGPLGIGAVVVKSEGQPERIAGYACSDCGQDFVPSDSIEEGRRLIAALVQVTHEDNAQEVWDEVEALRLWAGLPKFKFPDP